jgi:hypothetical protein
MFSTDYNRKITEQVNKINEDFIKHSKRVGRVGGGLLNVASVDKTLLARPVGGAKMEGDGFFGDIWDGIKKVFGGAIPAELVEEEMPEGGKKKKGKGLYTSKKLMKGVPEGLKIKNMRKKGKGLYEQDDLMEDEPVEAEPVGGRKKKGKKGGCMDCKEGGNILDDLVDDIGKVAPLIALGKPKKGKGMSGGVAKKSSPWIEHVKMYAKKHNMKYGDALGDAKCRATYKAKKM